MFTDDQLQALANQIDAVRRDGREILLRHAAIKTPHMILSRRYNIPPGTMGNLMRAVADQSLSLENAMHIIAGENRHDRERLA